MSYCPKLLKGGEGVGDSLGFRDGRIRVEGFMDLGSFDV